MDGVDETQAVLQGPHTGLVTASRRSPRPASWPGCPPHPEHLHVVQSRHQHQCLWCKQSARRMRHRGGQSQRIPLVHFLLPLSSVLGAGRFLWTEAPFARRSGTSHQPRRTWLTWKGPLLGSQPRRAGVPDQHSWGDARGSAMTRGSAPGRLYPKPPS